MLYFTINSKYISYIGISQPNRTFGLVQYKSDHATVLLFYTL